MFDNLQKKPEGIDDIFADVDSNLANKNVIQNPTNQTMSQTSSMPFDKNLKGSQPVNSSLYDDEKKSGSVLKKMFIFIIVIALIGAGAYFVYSQILLPKSMQNKQVSLNQTNQESAVEDNINKQNNDQELADENNIKDDVLFTDETGDPATSSNPVVEENISPEDVLKNLDSDFDGVNDYDETYIYKTDLYNPDSDGDNLNDFEESVIIGTDPLSQDSDGDTYLDGQELNGGYNPLGGGVLDISLFKNSELFKQKFTSLVEKFSL